MDPTARGVLLVALIIGVIAVGAAALIPSAGEIIVGLAFLATLGVVLAVPRSLLVRPTSRRRSRRRAAHKSDTDEFTAVPHPPH